MFARCIEDRHVLRPKSRSRSPPSSYYARIILCMNHTMHEENARAARVSADRHVLRPQHQPFVAPQRAPHHRHKHLRRRRPPPAAAAVLHRPHTRARAQTRGHNRTHARTQANARKFSHAQTRTRTPPPLPRTARTHAEHALAHTRFWLIGRIPPLWNRKLCFCYHHHHCCCCCCCCAAPAVASTVVVIFLLLLLLQLLLLYCY